MAKVKIIKPSKKEIQTALELSKRSAANIIDNKQLRDRYFEKLEKKLTDSIIKIEKLEAVPPMMCLIKDVSEKKYKSISTECLLDFSCAIAFVLSNKGISKSKVSSLSHLNASDVVQFVVSKYKNEFNRYKSWLKWEKPGIYPKMPIVILDEKEEKSIKALTDRYEKLISPSVAGKLTKKMNNIVPEKVKQMLEDVGHSIQNADFYDKVMSAAADGFDILIKNSAKVSISEVYLEAAI